MNTRRQQNLRNKRVRGVSPEPPNNEAEKQATKSNSLTLDSETNRFLSLMGLYKSKRLLINQKAFVRFFTD